MARLLVSALQVATPNVRYPPLQTFNARATSLGFSTDFPRVDVSARKVALDGRCVSRGSAIGHIGRNLISPTNAACISAPAARQPPARLRVARRKVSGSLEGEFDLDGDVRGKGRALVCPHTWEKQLKERKEPTLSNSNRRVRNERKTQEDRAALGESKKSETLVPAKDETFVSREPNQKAAALRSALQHALA